MKIIHESTEKIKLQLIPFIEALRGMQSLHEKSAHILNVTELLSEVMKERELMLMLAAVSNSDFDCMYCGFQDSCP